MTCSVEGCDTRTYKGNKKCAKHRRSAGMTRPCEVEGCPTRTYKGYTKCTAHRRKVEQRRATGPECEVEGCKRHLRLREGETRTKCTYHKTFTGTGTGGANKIEGVCDFEGCDRKRTQEGVCEGHKRQLRLHGIMWPIGTPNPKKKTQQRKEGRWNGYMGSEYSTERTCIRCGETKTWNRFVLGTDNMKDVCRDCHRAALSERVEVTTNPKAPRAKKAGKSNMEELLDFLNSRTN